MIYLPRTTGGQMALMSLGLVAIFATGTAFSAADQISTAKSDRAPLARISADSCAGQTWPNIDEGCLQNISTGHVGSQPVRYVTMSRDLPGNTTVLYRVPVSQQIAAR